MNETIPDMNNSFTVKATLRPGYERTVADIWFEGQRIAMITQEQGIEQMRVQIFVPQGSSLKLSLDAFILALHQAKLRLIEDHG